MIIFNHLYNDYSGSVRVFCDLINSLKDIKKKKVVITSSSAGFLENIDIDEIHYNSFSRSNIKIVIILSFLFSQLKSFFKIIFFYKNASNKKDIVIVNNTIYNIGATLAAALLDIKVVMIVHEITVNKLFKFLTMNLYKKHVNDVIYVSKFLKESQEILGPTAHILHNGLRADFNVSSDICLKKKFSQKKILFVGSLKAYKGIYDLIILAKRLPNYKFIVAINSSQNEFNSFLQQIDSLDNMNFFCRPDSGLLSNFYEEAFILINLSKPDGWVETFGLTLLEGMSYGCPVIAPKIGGHLDYINESHGLLDGIDNIENIISFIHNLSSSMEDFTNISKNCSQTSLDFSSTEYNLNAKKLFNCIFNKYNT